MSVKNCIFVLTSSFLLLTLSVVCLGQSTVSGDITGIVTDPSGAVLPNVAVTLTNTGTGAVVTANTNDQGVYRFSLLQPGTYTVEAKASGFQGLKKTANVTVGETTTQNMQLAVGSGNQTIEVSAEGGVVQTQNGNVSTTFSPQMVSLEPNPGNDLTVHHSVRARGNDEYASRLRQRLNLRIACHLQRVHGKWPERKRSVS